MPPAALIFTLGPTCLANSSTSAKVAPPLEKPVENVTTAVKEFETKDAIANGAVEIDMVINIGWLRDGKYDLVENEIRTLKAACGDKVLKVIIETCLLTDEEKIKMCELVTNAGADYIKTSTGCHRIVADLLDLRPGGGLEEQGVVYMLQDILVIHVLVFS